MHSLRKDKTDIRMKGIIIPAKWDSTGKILAVAISTHGEKEFLICNNPRGKELFGCLHELVCITGCFRKIKGIRCIEIDKIESCSSVPPAL